MAIFNSYVCLPEGILDLWSWTKQHFVTGDPGLHGKVQIWQHFVLDFLGHLTGMKKYINNMIPLLRYKNNIYIYVMYMYIYIYMYIYYTYYMEVSKVMVPQIIQSSWMTYQPFKLGHSDIVRWFSQSESSQWFSPRLRPLRWFNGLVLLGKFTGLSPMAHDLNGKLYGFRLKKILIFP